MPSPEQNRQTVLDFFKAWETGHFADIQAAYRRHLAPDVVYENSGVPPCNGIEEAIAFISGAAAMPQFDFQTIRVEVRHIAAVGNVVFTERVDWHHDSKGDATLVPVLCGVMEFNGEGRIQRWADYFDPGPMLAVLG